MGQELSYYKRRQAQLRDEYQLPEPVEKMFTQLRMPALRAEACTRMAGMTPKRRKDYEDFLAGIAQAEVINRAKSALDRQRKTAGLPTGVTFDHWDTSRSTIPVTAQEDLKTLEWIDHGKNLILVGPHGTGKSMFTELLASEAISTGKKVKWLTMEHLGAIVAASPIIATRTKAFDKLAKFDLLVIDDVGLIDINETQAEGLLRLITAAYGKTSMALGADPRKVDTSGGQYDGIMLTHAALASNSFGDRYPHQE